MRSLFRYSGFQNNKYPEILLEAEKKILQESFIDLSSDEIFYVVSHWQKYSELQSIEQELEDDRFFSLLQKEINSLN